MKTLQPVPGLGGALPLWEGELKLKDVMQAAPWGCKFYCVWCVDCHRYMVGLAGAMPESAHTHNLSPMLPNIDLAAEGFFGMGYRVISRDGQDVMQCEMCAAKAQKGVNDGQRDLRQDVRVDV